MICTKCAEAADGVDFGPVPVCSGCGQGPISVYNDARPVEEQSVVVHKKDGWRCPGSKRPPRLSTGHDFCKGCDCQHAPKGSYRGKPS